MNLSDRNGGVMASQFYSLVFVALTGVLGIVSPPDLPFVNAQSQTVQERQTEAVRLNYLGIQQFQTSQFEKAIQSWQQALTIFREIIDRHGESATLSNLGSTYYTLGKYEKAIEFYLQALKIAREIKNRQNEASALGNLGSTYYALGKYEKAIEFHLQLLVISQEIRYREGEGAALGNLGNTYYALGKYEKAIEFHLQRLAITKELKDRFGEKQTLGNLGAVYYALSKYEKAIEYSLKSSIIAKEIKDRHGEGYALGNLGVAYRAIGQYEKAIEYYLKALAISREINDRQSEGGALGNIGTVYYFLQKHEKAIEYYLKALAISREINDRHGEGMWVGNLGSAYDSLRKYDKAIEYHLQSIVIAKEIKDILGEGQSLGNLGITYYFLKKYDKAIKYGLQHLEISQKIKDREGESRSLIVIASTLATQNQPYLAILYYKQSVNVRESIRRDIRKLDKLEQKSYLGTVSSSYKFLADLLLKQGRIIEALQVLDLLKAQELEEYLKNIKGNERTSQGIRLLEPEKSFSDKLLAISPENSTEFNKQLSNQIQQLPKTEIDKAPDYLQNLPQGATILYPLILDDRLEIVIFAPNTPAIHRTVNIEKTELENLISAFRKNLTEPNRDARDSSKKLYDVLIKPIEEDLKQAKANTILYAPDGLLRYIPLASLYDGKQWLVERYRINNLIAYILFDQNRKNQSNPNIFAGAYGNSNQKLVSGFNQLPATLPEVESIQKTFANTTKITEKDFTAQASKDKAVGNSIVHLATHASFRSGSPSDSYVLFGDGSKATISDISEWNLKDVNLFVLSACQTGLGTSANGAEILGFGYQVQRAGAKASIASLWEVSDGGTQLLMQAFYSQIKQGDISTSEALRQAQIAMINSDKKAEGSDRAAGIKIVGTLPNNLAGKLSHPYYWSAFVLIGNGL